MRFDEANHDICMMLMIRECDISRRFIGDKICDIFLFLSNRFWREIKPRDVSVAPALKLFIAFLTTLPITNYSVGLFRVKAEY